MRMEIRFRLIDCIETKKWMTLATNRRKRKRAGFGISYNVLSAYNVLAASRHVSYLVNDFVYTDNLSFIG
jgi:hypothetical protein